jgi:hypothetical protein
MDHHISDISMQKTSPGLAPIISFVERDYLNNQSTIMVVFALG